MQLMTRAAEANSSAQHPAPRKRLMILGAGRGQVGLYRAAKRMNVATIAAGVPGDYPGRQLADYICDVDISSKESVLEAARAYRIDGIATSCIDTGVQALGYVCDTMGLSGPTMNAVTECYDKIEMKRKLALHGVPSPRAVVVDKEIYRQIIDSFRLPLVVKRRHSQGSSGVIVAQSKQEALDYLEHAFEWDNECLVEEFVEGIEFGAQAVVFGGRVHAVVAHGDILSGTRTPFPVGHYLPFDFGDDRCGSENLFPIVESAIQSMGLDNCAVNVDLMTTEKGVMILELTGRAGANALPELMSAYLGTDYYEIILNMALGNPPTGLSNRRREDRTFLGKMVLPSCDGILGEPSSPQVSGDVLNLEAFGVPGEEVHPYRSLGDCVGQIVVQGQSIEDCLALWSEQSKLSFPVLPMRDGVCKATGRIDNGGE